VCKADSIDNYDSDVLGLTDARICVSCRPILLKEIESKEDQFPERAKVEVCCCVAVCVGDDVVFVVGDDVVFVVVLLFVLVMMLYLLLVMMLYLLLVMMLCLLLCCCLCW